jgi:hypothetical protein
VSAVVNNHFHYIQFQMAEKKLDSPEELPYRAARAARLAHSLSFNKP